MNGIAELLDGVELTEAERAEVERVVRAAKERAVLRKGDEYRARLTDCGASHHLATLVSEGEVIVERPSRSVSPDGAAMYIVADGYLSRRNVARLGRLCELFLAGRYDESVEDVVADGDVPSGCEVNISDPLWANDNEDTLCIVAAGNPWAARAQLRHEGEYLGSVRLTSDQAERVGRFLLACAENGREGA
jgi:hypothetical protein